MKKGQKMDPFTLVNATYVQAVCSQNALQRRSKSRLVTAHLIGPTAVFCEEGKRTKSRWSIEDCTCTGYQKSIAQPYSNMCCHWRLVKNRFITSIASESDFRSWRESRLFFTLYCVIKSANCHCAIHCLAQFF